MAFQITAATPTHIPKIADIWHRGWHDAHDKIVPEALKRLRTDESFLARTKARLPQAEVAIRDGKVIGFFMTIGDELNQMYVSQDARGTGAAGALIEAAESRLRAEGHDLAWLACAIGNARAMRFYEKSGWVNQGRQMVTLDTIAGPFELDIWRYEKRLR